MIYFIHKILKKKRRKPLVKGTICWGSWKVSETSVSFTKHNVICRILAKVQTQTNSDIVSLNFWVWHFMETSDFTKYWWTKHINDLRRASLLFCQCLDAASFTFYKSLISWIRKSKARKGYIHAHKLPQQRCTCIFENRLSLQATDAPTLGFDDKIRPWPLSQGQCNTSSPAAM